jgi:phosphoribosylformimino-5-aminoimidazole carboxamide ribotide isomerase
MLIIPAIDLKEGKVVRFTQGKFNKKVYSHDPLKTAKHWVSQGAKFIHIVDLDGAIQGSPKNLDILRSIVKTIKIPVEFGGGVRNKETIKKIITMGVERVVLGTSAVENQRFLEEAFKKFNDKIIVSIDETGGNILTWGWRKKARSIKTLDLAKKLKKMGFNKIIYTDTSKDGTLRGPNIKGIIKILRETGLKVIASGGISSLKDIRRLKRLEKQGLLGVIIGKALYEGRFTLSEALRV